MALPNGREWLLLPSAPAPEPAARSRSVGAAARRDRERAVAGRSGIRQRGADPGDRSTARGSARVDYLDARSAVELRKSCSSDRRQSGGDQVTPFPRASTLAAPDDEGGVRL